MKKRYFALLFLAMFTLPLLMGSSMGQDNIVSMGNAVTVEADTRTASNVVVIGASATIKGQVDENVVVIFGNIYLEPTAVVRGNTVAVFGSVIRQPGAQVYGESVSVDLGGVPDIRGWRMPFRFFPGTRSIWRVLSVVFLGWVIFWLAPKPMYGVASAVKTDPLKSVLYGLLGYLALLPLTLMLIITLIGIPLVPFLWFAVLIARFVGQVALGLVAGQSIFRYLQRQEADVFAVVLGLLALGVITMIPVVGSLASLFYSMLGFGAVIWTRFGKQSVVSS